MDYFAHGFWSYIFFHRSKKPIYAVLFGLVPDTFSFFIYFFYKLIFEGGFSRPIVSEIPKWVMILYGISHSLFTVLIFFLVVYFIFRKIPIYMFAWPIAIIMDIPTHTKDFLPTPFLWPVSDYAFPGFSWGSKWFMIINYGLIIIAFGYIYYWKKFLKK